MKPINFNCIGTTSPGHGFSHALAMNVNALKTFGEVETYDVWNMAKSVKFDNTMVQALPTQTKWVIDNCPQALQGNRKIAYWVCESTALHSGFHEWAKLFDEIWTASEFCKLVLGALDKEVKVVPHVVTRYNFTKKNDRVFRFFSYFDGGSRILRKNPFAVVKAYVDAFGDREDVELVLKMKNVGTSIENFLKRETRKSNVVVYNENWNTDKMDAQLTASDCVVSLHKGEGFGLSMLEALAFGKPVIATGFGGCTDFLDDTNSLLVSYEMEECEDMLFGGHWASPDVKEASDFMVSMAEDKKLYSRLAEGARQTALNWGIGKLVDAMQKALY